MEGPREVLRIWGPAAPVASLAAHRGLPRKSILRRAGGEAYRSSAVAAEGRRSLPGRAA